MSEYYWCHSCERAFSTGKVYGNVVAAPGYRGGFSCPLCRAGAGNTVDWQTFIFGLGAANNYPLIPEDGGHYPLYPVE